MEKAKFSNEVYLQSIENIIIKQHRLSEPEKDWVWRMKLACMKPTSPDTKITQNQADQINTLYTRCYND